MGTSQNPTPVPGFLTTQPISFGGDYSVRKRRSPLKATLLPTHDLFAEEILWHQRKVKRRAFLLFLAAAAAVAVGVGVAMGWIGYHYWGKLGDTYLRMQ